MLSSRLTRHKRLDTFVTLFNRFIFLRIDSLRGCYLSILDTISVFPREKGAAVYVSNNVWLFIRY